MNSKVKNFLTFQKMLTPIIIQVIFWISVTACVVLGITLIVKGAGASFSGGKIVLEGILFLLLGPLVVRLYCEVLIILFRINDSLVAIKENTKQE